MVSTKPDWTKLQKKPNHSSEGQVRVQQVNLRGSEGLLTATKKNRKMTTCSPRCIKKGENRRIITTVLELNPNEYTKNKAFFTELSERVQVTRNSCNKTALSILPKQIAPIYAISSETTILRA